MPVEITWFKTAMASRFNAFAGCLVDSESMAMAYAKNNLPKPILGCLMIDSAGLPSLVKMVVDQNNNWVGKL